MVDSTTEIKLASNYGFREYPDYRRALGNDRGYYYVHPQFNITVLQTDDGWQAYDGRWIYNSKDLKDCLTKLLPDKYRKI